jgi:hypothetical protein
MKYRSRLLSRPATRRTGQAYSFAATVCHRGAYRMLDLILLAVGLGFFALSVGYAYACERL